MAKTKRKHNQDHSWIWLVSLLGIFFVFIIVCYGRGSLRANSSYQKTVSSIAESIKLTKYSPPTLKSLIVHPESTDNYFDFILDTQDEHANLAKLTRLESEDKLEPVVKELIDYFFLGITLPSEDLWVNLNSVRQNAITSPRLALTDIGKVLLEADLTLKKDCCRFTNPRTKTGKEYWNKLQARLNEAGLSTNQLPIGNRFWIIPAEAVVEEDKDNHTVTIVSSKLKVCLQQEYLELQNNQVSLLSDQSQDSKARLAQDIADFTMKETVLPAIQQEVNQGKAYAKLRQVYDSLILAEYYKQKYHSGQGLYSRLINRGYIEGLESNEPWNSEDFYNAYVKSAQEGEYRLTQSEYDPYLASMVQKYYFYGGILWTALNNIFEINAVTSETGTLSQGILEDMPSNGWWLARPGTLDEEGYDTIQEPYQGVQLAQFPEGVLTLPATSTMLSKVDIEEQAETSIDLVGEDILDITLTELYSRKAKKIDSIKAENDMALNDRYESIVEIDIDRTIELAQMRQLFYENGEFHLFGSGQDGGGIRGGRNKAKRWVTELHDLEQCKKAFEKWNEEGIYSSINPWRIIASVDALSDRERKSFREFIESGHFSLYSLFNFGSLSLYGRCDWVEYKPACELWERLHHLDVDRDLMICGGVGGFVANLDAEERELWLKVLRYAGKYKLLAHGTACYGDSQYPVQYDLKHQWALLNIMLEGEVNRGWYGDFNDVYYDMPQHVAYHGPYYVIFHRDTKFRWQDDDKGIKVPSKNHAIYLVPNEKAAQFFVQGLKEAAKLGLTTRQNADETISKVMTYQQFVDHHEWIEDIVKGEIKPAGVVYRSRPSITQQEIETAIDDINSVSGEVIFDDETKHEIVQKVLGMRLERGKSFLVVGPGSEDYLPVLLAKLGLKTSTIDTEEDMIRQQKQLYTRFGLERKIDTYDSYEAMKDKKFDYIACLAAIHYALDVLEDEKLKFLFQVHTGVIDLHSDIQTIEEVTKKYCKQKIAKAIRPILDHLNLNGGYIFVNSPRSVPIEVCRKNPYDIPFLQKDLYYLDEALLDLEKELNVHFSLQPQIDISNFSMHPANLSEKRTGVVYRSEKIEPKGEHKADSKHRESPLVPGDGISPNESAFSPLQDKGGIDLRDMGLEVK